MEKKIIMITTILFYILSFLLLTFAGLSNLIFFGFTLPSSIETTLSTFFVAMYKFDMWLNIGALLLAVKWFLIFIVFWYSFKILASIFNYFRGSGRIDE